MTDEVVIERRFRGPADSANGGYACGVLAASVQPAPAVEVTLRAPPPLDRPLQVKSTGEGAELCDGEVIVASAKPAGKPPIELSAVPTIEQATAARRSSPFGPGGGHPYPTCFVCGPDRAPTDGLRVTCGPVPDRDWDLVAAPLETDASMAGENGDLAEALVWAALDCPGGIASMLRPEQGQSVLGRLTAHIAAPLEVGPTYVAVGWPTGQEGRKLFAGSAILSRTGEVLAHASATWIELREQPPA